MNKKDEVQLVQFIRWETNDQRARYRNKRDHRFYGNLYRPHSSRAPRVAQIIVKYTMYLIGENKITKCYIRGCDA